MANSDYVLFIIRIKKFITNAEIIIMFPMNVPFSILIIFDWTILPKKAIKEPKIIDNITLLLLNFIPSNPNRVGIKNPPEKIVRPKSINPIIDLTFIASNRLNNPKIRIKILVKNILFLCGNRSEIIIDTFNKVVSAEEISADKSDIPIIINAQFGNIFFDKKSNGVIPLDFISVS